MLFQELIVVLLVKLINIFLFLGIDGAKGDSGDDGQNGAPGAPGKHIYINIFFHITLEQNKKNVLSTLLFNNNSLIMYRQVWLYYTINIC
jgi:hypothetical protein